MRSGKFKQVRRADQALYPIQSGSFVGRGPWLYATSPCNPEKISSKSPTRYKFYIYIEKLHKHTNTHLLWRHQGLHDERRFPSPNRSPRSTATLLRRGLFAKLWVQLQGVKLSWWPKKRGLAKSPLWCCEKISKWLDQKPPRQKRPTRAGFRGPLTTRTFLWLCHPPAVHGRSQVAKIYNVAAINGTNKYLCMFYNL